MKTRFSNCTKRFLKHLKFPRPWERHLHYKTAKNYETQSPCHVNTDHYHLENKQKQIIQAPYVLLGLQIQPVGIRIFTPPMFYLTYPASFLVPLSARVISLSCFFFPGRDCQSQLRRTHQTKPHLSALSNVCSRPWLFLRECTKARSSSQKELENCQTKSYFSYYLGKIFSSFTSHYYQFVISVLLSNSSVSFPFFFTTTPIATFLTNLPLLS